MLSPVIIYDVNSQPLAFSQQNNNDEFVIDNISDNVNDSVYPQVASFGNTVYVTWEESVFDNNPLNYDVLLKTSTDGGRTFGDITNLSNNTGFSEHPQISVNGSNVYVVWADNTSSNRDIYLIFSTDGGRTFGDVINLSNNAGTSSFPKVSSFENDVYVIWNIDREDEASTIYGKKDGVFFAKSTDGGNSFSKEIMVNLDEKPGEAQIAANDNDVYVVWGSPDPSVAQNNNIGVNDGNGVGGGGGGIFFAISTDGGNSFTSPIFIKEKFNSSHNVEIVSDSDELIIAVQGSVNEPGRNQDIFLMKSLDRGNTFSSAQNISNNAGVSECPSAAVSLDNGIFLTWQDNTPGNNDVLSTNII
ncbi:MAG TPA: sialidase family protein [Phototrophicaceae bacterium]|nr:sialidase family protein [Phototrophicaceae bacterium]